MNVLLRGVFLGMKHAAPIMKRQRSRQHHQHRQRRRTRGRPGPHIYSAAKAAVINLTRSVALELARVQRARQLHLSGRDRHAAARRRIVGGEEAMPALRTRSPASSRLERSGLPEDIANTALWLSSDEASFITGQAIVVDGGLTAGRKWSQQSEGMRTRRPMS